MNYRIIIADDDINVIAGLKFLLEDEGYSLVTVTTPEALIEQVKKQPADLVLLDMNFKLDTTSGQEGLNLISALRKLDEILPIVMMTGWASVELAVSALKLGANDFFQKPWDDERLLHSISNLIAAAKNVKKVACLTRENNLLKSQQAELYQPDLIAESSVMKNCLLQLSQLAKSDMNILLTGENGTGKSVLAHFIHKNSLRSEQPMICVNMGAISENLFESEMFGHVKGAFTDAKENRIGRFELATGGSLFLDEIANIPLSQQAKLLRVLEESRYEQVGSSKTLTADSRIISATNADLDPLICKGGFRQDLYYRLNTVTIHIPSLRERWEDIIPLANYYLTLYAHKYQRITPELSEKAQRELQNYTWPGNVRELSHLMERLLFTCSSDIIDEGDLNLVPSSVKDKGHDIAGDIESTLDEIEKNAIIARLKYYQGSVSQASKSLGLSRSGWYRRVEKFGL